MRDTSADELLLAGCYDKMYKLAFCRYRLSRRHNQNCYEANTKHPKSPNWVDAEGSAKDGTRDDEAAVLKKDPNGNFARTPSNEKETEVGSITYYAKCRALHDRGASAEDEGD